MRKQSRAAVAAVAFAGVAAAGIALAAPAEAAITNVQIDSSNLFGSLDTRYGAGCAYGVIATVDTDEQVTFAANNTQFGSVAPQDGKATGFWIPFAPGTYTLTVKQGQSTKTISPLTVGLGVYTGSSCIVIS
ncbi:hypothetical protein AAFP35_24195 [Gordonia sp. CPCC 206044]|uniref:hypothetical protein n=1 Tax=Gordonia sp. CPCC 206044 TaxID=3140793 RepID=UPI003AF3E331